METLLIVLFFVALVFAVMASIAYFGRQSDGVCFSILDRNASNWRGSAFWKVFQIAVPIGLFLFVSWGFGLLLGYINFLGYLHTKRQPIPSSV